MPHAPASPGATAAGASADDRRARRAVADLVLRVEVNSGTVFHQPEAGRELADAELYSVEARSATGSMHHRVAPRRRPCRNRHDHRRIPALVGHRFLGVDELGCRPNVCADHRGAWRRAQHTSERGATESHLVHVPRSASTRSPTAQPSARSTLHVLVRDQSPARCRRTATPAPGRARASRGAVREVADARSTPATPRVDGADARPSCTARGRRDSSPGPPRGAYCSPRRRWAQSTDRRGSDQGTATGLTFTLTAPHRRSAPAW